MDSHTAYIALGSNVGDSAATLLDAVKRIDEIDHTEVLRISQFVRTAPVGGPEDQPAYLNAAVCVSTELPPPDLLERLQKIEVALGRDRARETRWGPRTCDLDLLLYDEQTSDTDALTLPHPRMHERRFVLGPLAQIAPRARHPGLDKTVARLLAELESDV
ncbi:MAG: 2-amino-4-hydroxy-6-hydroxymethyldihydropteridine diphosphokinase [Phycisphaerae bacterium]|nr:2-amino-4-hydroxy-6-hydroxymethyldihydropteridine diphosphokinase [Phycisphaerae bacterium]